MTTTPDLEILGLISTQHASETHAAKSQWIDKAYLAAHAKAHEYAGFDRVLIGYNAASPDGFQVAAYAAAQTTKLKFLLAHRPGVTAPTVAARQLATLDQLSDGRLAVHIITGGSDEEQRRDGDYLTKAERYARTDDYITVLKKALESDGPFDHEGPYYKVEGAPAAVKSLQQPRLPIFFGGASDEALDVASRQADVYALFGETLEQAAEIVGRVRDGAKAHGREIKFSMSLRPIIARTEDEAWAKAARILDDAKALKEARGGASRYVTARGGQRLIEAAQGGAVRDKRLWTEIAALTGAQGNSTSLVGTPEQVVESLLEYYDLGITKFLFRGFDPLEDAIQYGHELLPALRAAVAAKGAPRVLAAE